MGQRPRELYSGSMFHLVLPFALLASVAGHGGVLWPPTWQAGFVTPIKELKHSAVYSVPTVRDPSTKFHIFWARSWLSDQSYTGGYGDEFRGVGPFTNDYQHPNPWARCRKTCQEGRHPWAAPGIAPSLGGGCGVMGGNPYGCPKGKDTRPPGSPCGQVAANGGHLGGYTYRLCKLPEGGRTALTEECFANNILEFATNFTMIKPMNKHLDVGFDWGHGKTVEEKWERLDQVDLRH